MSQRTLLLVSAGLTGLGLLGAGFLIGRSPAAPPEARAADELPPDREQAYRALIAEANSRIATQQRALREARQSCARSAPTAAPPVAEQQSETWLAQTEAAGRRRGHHDDDEEDGDD